MKRSAILALMVAISACDQPEPQVVAPMIEQATARHSQVLTEFAAAHEQYVAGADQTIQDMEVLVEKGASSGLSEQEASKLEMLSAEAETEQGRLRSVSQRLAGSTLDLIALTAVARETCGLDAERPAAAAQVDDFRARYTNVQELQAQYEQALAEYREKLAGIDSKAECAEYRAAEASINGLIVRTAGLFAD